MALIILVTLYFFFNFFFLVSMFKVVDGRLGSCCSVTYWEQLLLGVRKNVVSFFFSNSFVAHDLSTYSKIHLG